MQIGLGVNPTYLIDERADAIAITLSEAELNAAALAPTWQLDVWAASDAGKTYVGTLNTVGVSNGLMQNRLVGYALCPGARAWMIEATGPKTGPGGAAIYGAQLKAQPCKPAAFGIVPGVYRPGARALIGGNFIGGEGSAIPTFPLALGRTDSLGPTAFSAADGSNESAATIWIMWFNAVATPANGTQPAYGLAFNVPAGGSFNWIAPTNGLFFPVGLTWAASTTPDTLTLAAGTPARVRTYTQW